MLLDPTYDLIVTRDPDRSQLEAALPPPQYLLCYGPDGTCDAFENLERVTAIVNARSRNLAGVRTSGIDLTVAYRWSTAVGEWGLRLNGAQFVKNRERLVSTAPEISSMNNVWRPVDFRSNASLSFARDGLNVVAAVNYTDDYRDNRGGGWVNESLQRSTVASWTTIDLTLQYDLGVAWPTSWLRATTLTLGAINLFDRDPPYIASAEGFNFDGVNANPRGRFLSAQLTARW